MLGFRLPPSALAYPAWWANEARKGKHSAAWLGAGWMTQNVDLVDQTVRFARRSGRGSKDVPSSVISGPAGAETAKFPQLSLSIRLRWKTLGPIRLREGGLRFPQAAEGPGLYRFRLIGRGGGQCLPWRDDELAAAVSTVRSPGPTQATNIRLNGMLREQISSGGRAEVDIIEDDVRLVIDDLDRAADLHEKAVRRLLEHAALVAEGGTDVQSLNR